LADVAQFTLQTKTTSLQCMAKLAFQNLIG